MPESKPGLKTSEFWGNLIFKIVVLVIAFAAFERDHDMLASVALMAGGLSTASYSLSRGLAKQAPTPKE